MSVREELIWNQNVYETTWCHEKTLILGQALRRSFRTVVVI
jgi:hypothetical protein